MDEKLADLLLDPAAVPAEVHRHVADCEDCRREIDELQAAMRAMDGWQAPEPSPFFVPRMKARLREAQETEAAGWLSRLRARFAYRPQTHFRPLAAMALTAVLLVGGGAYVSVSNIVTPAPMPANDAAVVNDLQTLENNAQLLDTLESLSGPPENGNAGTWER